MSLGTWSAWRNIRVPGYTCHWKIWKGTFQRHSVPRFWRMSTLLRCFHCDLLGNRTWLSRSSTSPIQSSQCHRMVPFNQATGTKTEKFMVILWWFYSLILWLVWWFGMQLSNFLVPRNVLNYVDWVNSESNQRIFRGCDRDSNSCQVSRCPSTLSEGLLPKSHRR